MTARWHPHQQGDSPTVPEQGEQGRSAKGNQGQSQPRQGPGDKRGPRSSQQVRIRTRHRHSSNVAQARTMVEGLSSNVAPRQRRDVQKKHLAALCVPSSLIPAYTAAPHQSWPPVQAASPCLGGRGCRGWGCTWGPAAGFLLDLYLSSSFSAHVCDRGHKTNFSVCLTLHMKRSRVRQRVMLPGQDLQQLAQ